MTDLVQAVQLFQAEWPSALEQWERSDPVLYAIAPSSPVERLMEVTPRPFGALVRSILHQQVSIYAGRAIMGRLVEAAGEDLEPEAVLALTDDQTRQIGMSRQKVIYVRALAVAGAAGELEGLDREPDEAVIARLVKLPGIGVWTAKMFCMFHLMRLDVFSGDDLGLREGIRFLDGLVTGPTPAEAERRAEAWRPYRSVAAVVLWDFLRRTRAENSEQRLAEQATRPRGKGGRASTKA